MGVYIICVRRRRTHVDHDAVALLRLLGEVEGELGHGEYVLGCQQNEHMYPNEIENICVSLNRFMSMRNCLQPWKL